MDESGSLVGSKKHETEHGRSHPELYGSQPRDSWYPDGSPFSDAWSTLLHFAADDKVQRAGLESAVFLFITIRVLEAQISFKAVASVIVWTEGFRDVGAWVVLETPMWSIHVKS